MAALAISICVLPREVKTALSIADEPASQPQQNYPIHFERIQCPLSLAWNMALLDIHAIPI